MYFLDDRLELGLVDPVIVASLALSVLAMAFAIRQRRILRFHPRRGADYHVFRLDLATALLWWGLAQVGTVIGWLLRIEGMRMPIWPYLFLIVGVAIGVIAWLKERRGGWSAAARSEGADLQTDGSVREVHSETWQFGLLGGAALGFLAYMVSAGHTYGHPLHWMISGAAILAGYGLGLVIMTPQTQVKVHPPKAVGVGRT